MPTALAKPWPSGPVVTSMPGVWPRSGCPGVREPHWRNCFRSSRRQVVAGQVQQRVLQHAGVARAEHEAVAVGPLGVGRVGPQEALEQRVRQRRERHRRARDARRWPSAPRPSPGRGSCRSTALTRVGIRQRSACGDAPLDSVDGHRHAPRPRALESVIMPEQFCDVGRGITLCYETFGEPSDPTALLIMGLGTQMIAWHEDFCRELAERGPARRALRQPRHRPLDPRAGSRRRRSPQLLRARKRAARYTLADMAEDAAGLLERARARARARDRRLDGRDDRPDARGAPPAAVRSLVSIMSNTGSAASGQPALRVYSDLPAHARPREREAFIEHADRAVRRDRLDAACRGTPTEVRELAGTQLRPRPRPARPRAPARRDHRLGRPHRGTAHASPRRRS